MRNLNLFKGAAAAPVLMTKSRDETFQARTALGAPAINKSRSNVFLGRRNATTFAPREDTRLRVTEGRLWITFEAPPNGLAPRNGDHFVAAGECFDLLAGEAAVLEPVGSGPGAFFDLEPALTLPWRAVAQQVGANLSRSLGAARQAFAPAAGQHQKC